MFRKGILYLAFLFALAVSILAAAAPNRNDQKPAYRTINYDFLKSRTDVGNVGELKVWCRQDVLLKVESINPFLYDIVVNGLTVSYNQTIPTLLATALSGISIGEADKAVGEKKTDRFKMSEEEIRNVEVLENKYQAADKQFRFAIAAIYRIIPAAEKTVIECVGYSDDLTKDQILEKIKLGIKSLYGKGANDPNGMRKVLLPLFDNVKEAWIDLENAYNHLVEKGVNGSYEKSFEAEKNRWTTFQKTDEAVLKNALDNAVGTWRAVDSASFQAVGGPFQADGDELTLKITASRKEGVDARFPTKHVCTDKTVAVLRIKGGIKLDFSTGFIFAGPTDRSYSLRMNADGDNEIVRNGRATEGICAISPGVFIHIYPRTAADMALALTISLAINKSSIVDYYMGPSLLIGSSRRIALNTGIGIRTISTLSSDYREHDILPSDVGTIPLVNTIHFAYFIGVSFNLGGT